MTAVRKSRSPRNSQLAEGVGKKRLLDKAIYQWTFPPRNLLGKRRDWKNGWVRAPWKHVVRIRCFWWSWEWTRVVGSRNSRKACKQKLLPRTMSHTREATALTWVVGYRTRLMVRETVPSQHLNYHTNTIKKNTTASTWEIRKWLFEPEWRLEPSGFGSKHQIVGESRQVFFLLRIAPNLLSSKLQHSLQQWA